MSSSDQESPLSGSAPSPADGRLQELRDILMREDRVYLTQTVQSVLAEATAGRVEASKDQMAESLAPVLGQALRRQIQESQDDIVDALYPIIGKAIQRAVAEAMRSLAQRVDEGLRNTFSMKRLARRIQAKVQGIPESELLLREALPCQVQQVFLIHRGSGVLLKHLSRKPGHDSDTDLISSMLTAIRDFAQDTLGTEREGDLGQIQYGDLSILVEPGPWAYLAVVIEGYAPEGFRHRMRNALSDVNRACATVLENYDGDASCLAGAEEHLSPLLAAQAPVESRAAARPPWPAIAAASAILLLCVTLACLGAWRITWGRPTPTPVALAPLAATATAPASGTPTPLPPTPTDTSIATPTPAPSDTAIPSQTPAPTPTSTSVPPQATTPAPYVGVMIGNVWLRAEPRDDSVVTSVRVDQARPVEVLAIYGDWYLVRWPPGDPSGPSGWVPGRWVGLFGAPPLSIITPAP